MFVGKAAGIWALANATARTHFTTLLPRVLHATDEGFALPALGDEARSFLATEFPAEVEDEMPSAELLGETMAAIHRSPPEHPLARDGHFGFGVKTVLEGEPQRNEWSSDWVHFFRVQRIELELGRLALGGDETNLQKMWGRVLRATDGLKMLFAGVDVKPALIHGDLWTRNIRSHGGGQVVLLEPASYYAHDEAEWGLSQCWSATNDPEYMGTFWKSYRRTVPRAPGFKERAALYELYHQLNLWNAFGNENSSKRARTLMKFIGEQFQQGVAELSPPAQARERALRRLQLLQRRKPRGAAAPDVAAYGPCPHCFDVGFDTGSCWHMQRAQGELFELYLNWLREWRAKLSAWWAALPDNDGLQACTGAIALTLAQKLQRALSKVNFNGAGAPDPDAGPRPDGPCAWVRKADKELLEIPELPETPESMKKFQLPAPSLGPWLPIPRLLPRLWDMSAREDDTRLALFSVPTHSSAPAHSSVSTLGDDEALAERIERSLLLEGGARMRIARAANAQVPRRRAAWSAAWSVAAGAGAATLALGGALLLKARVRPASGGRPALRKLRATSQAPMSRRTK